MGAAEMERAGRHREARRRYRGYTSQMDEMGVLRSRISGARLWVEELCRHALANTRRCLEILRSNPRSGANYDRQHRLRGDLATHRHNNRDMEQWKYEVTSGGRVRHAIDDENRTVCGRDSQPVTGTGRVPSAGCGALRPSAKALAEGRAQSPKAT